MIKYSTDDVCKISTVVNDRYRFFVRASQRTRSFLVRQALLRLPGSRMLTWDDLTPDAQQEYIHKLAAVGHVRLDQLIGRYQDYSVIYTIRDPYNLYLSLYCSYLSHEALFHVPPCENWDLASFFSFLRSKTNNFQFDHTLSYDYIFHRDRYTVRLVRYEQYAEDTAAALMDLGVSLGEINAVMHALQTLPTFHPSPTPCMHQSHGCRQLIKNMEHVLYNEVYSDA